MATIKTAVTAAIMMLMFLARRTSRCAGVATKTRTADKVRDQQRRCLHAANAERTLPDKQLRQRCSETTHKHPVRHSRAKFNSSEKSSSAQQALLQSQQARIAQLENQLHVGTGAAGGSGRQSCIGICSVAAIQFSPPLRHLQARRNLSLQQWRQPNPPQSGGTQKPGEQPPSPLSWRIGAAEFTPGGWADIMGVFRSSDIGSGTGTSFGSIPFNNQLPQAALTEFRATAQTSRLSMKVNANINDSTSVLGYVESDFNGFQPPERLHQHKQRHVPIAFGFRRHQARQVGSNWRTNLVTDHSEPRRPLPDAVRRLHRLPLGHELLSRGWPIPGKRHSAWSIIRPIGGPSVLLWRILSNMRLPRSSFRSTFFSGQFDNGSGATNGTGATSNPAIPDLHPDVIVKSAFDWKIGEHALHLEAAGLIRSFKMFNNLSTPMRRMPLPKVPAR